MTNLLLIWTDEQRADTMACYGNPDVTAPNLNRLASESFVFEHAYCCQPVCTPSRGCIMTGQWPHQHGARGNNLPLSRAAMTIAERVDPCYRRAYYGKWHLGDEIRAQRGFDEWLSIEDGAYRAHYTDPADLERRSDYHRFLFERGYPPDGCAADGGAVYTRPFAAALPWPLTKAAFLGREAARFLQGHDRERPFLLSVNFLEPHMPFFGPFNERHDPAALRVGPAFARPPADDASLRNRALAARYRRDGQGGWPLSSEWHWRRMAANYQGLVTMVDRAVGCILDALEEAGLADRTVVAFTSDHGEMMGDHALVAKGVMYEQALRVPLLLRVPWLGGGLRVPGRISQIDLAPTLLDLLGVPGVPGETGRPPGAGFAGCSRRAVLEGSADLGDNDVFAIWEGSEYEAGDVTVPGASRAQLEAVAGQSWRTIITHDGWKLSRCATDPSNELYDLNTDPHEMHNLFADPDQRGRIADLTERIVAWQHQVGDGSPPARAPGP